MKNSLIFLFILLGFSACSNNSDKDKSCNACENRGTEMYEPSEMAALMNRMYNINDSLKKMIVLNGEIPTAYPQEFDAIETAELTDSDDKDESFISFAKIYISHAKSVSESKTIAEAKERYTNTIKTCISCHQEHCGGPLEKIRKLELE